MEHLLVAEKISKKFGAHTALNDFSLEIQKGSIFGLLGPNGAGKTTFIRIINQIMVPDQGYLFLDGKKIEPKDVRNIGYLPEERGLYNSMRVGEQAMYLAQLKGLSRSEARERLHYWFDRLNIKDWWGKKIQELSKGMAQKVQFIVTVLHRPKLLIFDEPFSGFDPVNAGIIKDEILQLRQEGATIVFSTHRMESVEEMCDYMALVHRGNKLLDGEVRAIKRRFRSNMFEVGLIADKKEELQRELREKYHIREADFKSIDDDLQLRVELPEGNSPNDLLNFLITRAQVIHFTEVIPSVNDIFIKTVTAHA